MSLSTHALDLTVGRPAAGLRLALEQGGVTLFDGVTDDDGRCPALKDLAGATGRYRLRFGVAAYFHAQGHDLPDPPFLDEVTIDFGIAEPAGHYHVPLLVTPFAYSTYRGS
ncbi:hydroxyisourate hydrolase [uncultured Sphingomonas sp.]|uniref:hydroxyisourate hydrolase n=1 Tax=uncultured Sphingomonas sp. TaxID=158754 RepID=UPI0035CAE2F2